MDGWRRMLMVGAVLGAATGVTGAGAPARAIVEDPEPVSADAETEPVLNSGDAADDPAIWVHPTNPALSIVIGNDKQGALEVYGLDGARRQRITTATTFWGNVDVRQDVTIGGQTLDVVASYNGGLRLFTVDPATRLLELITDGTGAIPTGGGEGICLYDSATTGDVSAIVIAITGRVRQYKIHDGDGDGLLEGTLVREFQVGSESEGCVTDDDNGALYISEEDVGLWRYGAEPTAGAARSAVDSVQPSGHLAADGEGVTLVDEPDGSGYVLVSSQNTASPSQNYYVVYDRLTNAYVKSFKIVDGTADGCSRTDGIAATAASLGPSFPQGVFICQDNNNFAPGSAGNQNFKLTRLEKVVELDEEPPPPSALSFVGSASTNANATSHAVRIPATTQAGDTLLLFFAGNQNPATTSSPTGWTLVRSADPTGIRGRLWFKTATAGDAGSLVTVTSSAILKAALTVGAYSGAPAANPIDVSAVAVDTATTSTHVAPSVTPQASGGWLVTYWADKSTSSTSLSTTPSLVRRGGSTGTGGGHITSALADSGTGVPAGPTGGQVATGTAPASKAVMFSLVLRSSTMATNQPPSASFTVSCVELSCSFDSIASDDPDGSITSYAWQFGDGTTATGPSPSHTYGSAGSRTVTLTVTDDDGASDGTTRTANPTDPVPPSAVSFVAAASANANAVNHSVRVPADVQAGDTMLLFFAGNQNPSSTTAPAGWSLVQSSDPSGMRGRFWTKTATSSAAGTLVTVSNTVILKADLTVAAYRGTAPNAIDVSAVAVDTVIRSTHTAPSVTPTQAGGWLVAYWADKASENTVLLQPEELTRRSGSSGTGGGHITSALADSGTGVPAAPTGGLIATGAAPASRAVMFTVALRRSS